MQIDTFHAQSDAANEAIVWVQALLVGSIASMIAILAVAIVGLLMLGGRMPLRRGAWVVIGCFILFSAAAIADGLLASTDGPEAEIASTPPAPAYTATAPHAVTDDPYAGSAVPVRR